MKDGSSGTNRGTPRMGFPGRSLRGETMFRRVEEAWARAHGAVPPSLLNGWLSRGPSSSWRPSWQPSSSSWPWNWLLAMSTRTRISRPVPRVLCVRNWPTFRRVNDRLRGRNTRRCESCEGWPRKLSREVREKIPDFFRQTIGPDEPHHGVPSRESVSGDVGMTAAASRPCGLAPRHRASQTACRSPAR